MEERVERERTVLSDKDERLIDGQMESGNWPSREAVVHAGLERLGDKSSPTVGVAECEALIAQGGLDWTPEALREEFQKGLDSGPGRPWDYDAFLSEARRRNGL